MSAEYSCDDAICFQLIPSCTRWRLHLSKASWDLWLDYHRRDTDKLTHGNVRKARSDLELAPGRYVVVGNEVAEKRQSRTSYGSCTTAWYSCACFGIVERDRARLQTVPTPANPPLTRHRVP